MGVLNVIKGAYPSLQQIDRTLSVDSRDSGIVRGSCMFEEGGKFRLATAAQAGSVTGDVITPGAYIYFCLMDQTDLVAAMAGSIGQGVGGGEAKVTGLACSMPMEIETDQFTGSPAVGTFLTTGADGKLVAVTAATGNTAIGQVTQGVTTRWANDAVAITGWRTGNKVNVIRLRTMYVPGLKLA